MGQRLAAALAVGVALSMLHGYACVSHGGDQVVLGMAITMTAAGLTVVLGIAWFAQGGQTPPVPDSVRLGGWFGGAGARVAQLPWVGPALALAFFGHNPLVYLALALVAGVWWLLYRSLQPLANRITLNGTTPQALLTQKGQRVSEALWLISSSPEYALQR